MHASRATKSLAARLGWWLKAYFVFVAILVLAGWLGVTAGQLLPTGVASQVASME